ncbi:MAG: tight adherence protein TadE [Proteobacteria bacterium SG_bin6]|nr:MAG: tight adherence protein TadE [Proteobacteria bacterium SG_bin6]
MTRRPLVSRLARDERGLALVEFAFVTPIILLLGLTGAEFANYITVRMRVSQLALRIVDDAARIGTGSQLAAKTITETDINDLFIGANQQSGTLNLAQRGRVVLSDLEPMANPNTTNKYKIVWQRCYGAKTNYTRQYGTAGQTDLDGMGPSGRQVTAQDDNATMFVEVYYEYQPLITTALLPTLTFTDTAAMAVRDRRDLTQIYNTEGATIATC